MRKRTIRSIDAHAAGEPLRLLTEGVPTLRGTTMLDKRAWMGRYADHIRRAVMLEPRGHADMCGALLTEPASPGAHAGILFMDNGGYSAMCGHGIIAATTIVLERGLLIPGGDGRTIVFDTPAGLVRATATFRADRTGQSGRAETARAATTSGPGAGTTPPDAASEGRRVEIVSFTTVPSFVLQAGLPVAVGARRIRADVAFGGEFYAIVDSEAVGLPIDPAHLPELRRAAATIKEALERSIEVKHPTEPLLRGIHGVVFTSPASNDAAALRNVTVFADAQVDRSASGNGTAAVLSVIDAMGLLADDEPFVHEGVLGTTFSGRVTGRTQVGDYPAVVAEIRGAAWITGEHTFVVADDDPLAEGFRL